MSLLKRVAVEYKMLIKEMIISPRPQKHVSLYRVQKLNEANPSAFVKKLFKKPVMFPRLSKVLKIENIFLRH